MIRWKKDVIINIMKEICKEYELIKKFKRYWNSEIVEFKVDCK